MICSAAVDNEVIMLAYIFGAHLTSMSMYSSMCFMTSSSALDALNNAAVRPERWNVHAAASSKTDFGHGGLYYRLWPAS
jgi:hypothetical protein